MDQTTNHHTTCIDGSADDGASPSGAVSLEAVIAGHRQIPTTTADRNGIRLEPSGANSRYSDVQVSDGGNQP